MQHFFFGVLLVVPLACFPQSAHAQSSARAYFRKGLELMKAGNYSEAISVYSRAIDLDPRYSDAYCERGRAWHELKENDKAMSDFDQALRLNPNDVEAHNNRGNVWDDNGDYDKAIADFNQALRLDPRNAEVYYNRGIAWTKKGEYDKAVADYNETVRLDPNEVDAYINIALLQATCPDQRIRDGQKAMHNAKKAYQLSGESKWQSLSALAAAYAESGDFDSAVKWETKTIEMVKNDKSAEAKDIEEEHSCLELYKHGKPYHKEPKKK